MNIRDGRSPVHRRQRGFSMLEILVTLFLLTLWLLASAGVQSSSLQFNKAAQFRTQAIYLATDLAERMQANKVGAIAGNYVIAETTLTDSTPPDTCIRTDAETAPCSPTALATFDLDDWKARVYDAGLPNVTVAVSANPVANPITYTIVIGWTDRRTERTYAATGTTESFSYTATKTIFNPPS
jgi:type IV pilus assembly protein PilV